MEEIISFGLLFLLWEIFHHAILGVVGWYGWKYVKKTKSYEWVNCKYCEFKSYLTKGRYEGKCKE